MKIVILGNCQAAQLRSQIVSETHAAQVIFITRDTQLDEAQVYEHLDAADLVVSRVYGRDEDYLHFRALRRQLGAKLILIPTVENASYHPDFAYMTDVDVGGNPYISRIAVDAFVNGGSIAAAADRFDAGDHDRDEGYLDLSAASSRAMHRLDEITDVKMGPFMDDNIRDFYCLHTLNHPTMHVISEIARQIYSHADIKPRASTPAGSLLDPSLMGPVLPISEAVRTTLGIKFPTNRLFKGAAASVTDHEWFDYAEYTRRLFRVLQARERRNLIGARISAISASPQERHMLLAFAFGSHKRVGSGHLARPSAGDVTSYELIPGDRCRIRMVNDTDAVMIFDARHPLTIRVILWDAGRLIARDHFSFITALRVLAPGEMVTFDVPVPHRYVRGDAAAGLHLRFGLVHEQVRWIATELDRVAGCEADAEDAARGDDPVSSFDPVRDTAAVPILHASGSAGAR